MDNRRLIREVTVWSSDIVELQVYTMLPFVCVHIRVHIRTISRQAGKYEVFPFISMSVRHPF